MTNSTTPTTRRPDYWIEVATPTGPWRVSRECYRDEDGIKRYYEDERLDVEPTLEDTFSGTRSTYVEAIDSLISLIERCTDGQAVRLTASDGTGRDFIATMWMRPSRACAWLRDIKTGASR